MSKKIGVVRFPGSNCDYDVFNFVVEKGFSAEFLWHLDQFEVSGYEALILPGGFSYGDYLRAGALSARSPVMGSVREFAKKGGPILGICNGFQVLVETYMLPGALVRNEGQKFIDDWVNLTIQNPQPYFGKNLKSKNLRLPIAHGEGRYFAREDDLKRIEDDNLIWMTYDQCPNGSLRNIAGVMNKAKNVAGLMPHPERALFDWMGSLDGWGFL